MDCDLIFLHGFLGLPSDWQALLNSPSLEESIKNYETTGSLHFYCPDYFNIPSLSPNFPFQEFAKNFVQWVHSNTHSDRKILIGYSLGGRLAFAVFEQAPEMFAKLFLLSTHPGLKSEEEKDLRRINDSNWAKLFLSTNWEDLMQCWNQQSVFAGSKAEPQRQEMNFSREYLKLALEKWSLANQESKVLLIKKYFSQIVYVVGKDDTKFTDLARQLLEQVPGLQCFILNNSGHRVLFDQPEEIAKLLAQELFRSHRNLI